MTLRRSLAGILLCCWAAAIPQSADAQTTSPVEEDSRRRVIVVGGDRNYPPYEYLDETGQPAGYNVDLTRAVARAMGLDVEIRLGPWSEIRNALATGEIDAIQGMFFSEQRANVFGFSPPHKIVHHALFVRKDEEDIRSLDDVLGKRIVVMRGDIMHDYAVENNLTDDLILTETQEEALRRLSAGQADAALVARLPGLFWIEKLGLDNLETTGEFFAPRKYCFAVRKGDDALLADFTEGLAILKNTGEYRRIRDRWLGVDLEGSSAWRIVGKYLLLIGGPLLVLTLLVLGWSVALRRRVRVRTTELQAEAEQHKHTAEQLRRTQQRLNDFLDSVEDMVYFQGLDGSLDSLNRANERITGYTLDEFRVNPQLWREIVHPDDRAEAEAFFRQHPKGVASHEAEYRLKHRDGQWRWLQSRMVAARDREGNIIGYNCIDRDITEQKLAQQALQEGEARLRALFENSPLGIMTVDLETFRNISNPAMQRMLGYSAEELAGLGFRDFTHPDDLPREEPLAGKVIRGDLDHYELEKRYLRKDGSIFWGHLHITLVRRTDGKPWFVVGMVQDIDRRKTALQALQESRQRLAALFDNSLDAILLADDTGKYIDANPAAADMIGCSQEELLGSTLGDLSPEPTRQEIQQAWDAFKTEGRQAGEIELLRSDGKTVPVEYRAVANILPGVHLAVLRDITERREAERDRRDMEQRVRQMQKLESLGILAGGIAHDFNNLLVAILGNADLALRDLGKDHPVRETLEEIRSASLRCSELSRQMLAYSGKGAFVLQHVNLNRQVEETLRILRASLPKKITIHTVLGERLPAMEGDPTQISQVVLNLMTNAAEAVGDHVGQITLRTTVQDVDPDLLAETVYTDEKLIGPHLLLEVSDTGCGMTGETRQRIFDPFYTTKFAGRGMGMGVVLGIVRGHRGAIYIRSAPGKGSTIGVLFPTADATDVPSVQEQPSTPEDFELQGTTLLVADDEPSVRQFLDKMLRRLGCNVLTAEDGQQAVDLFVEHADAIDACLIDLTMPRLGGDEAAREILRHRPRARIILCSGYNEQEATRRFEETGLAAFIQKPFEVDKLRDTLQEVLNR